MLEERKGKVKRKKEGEKIQKRERGRERDGVVCVNVEYAEDSQ